MVRGSARIGCGGRFLGRKAFWNLHELLYRRRGHGAVTAVSGIAGGRPVLRVHGADRYDIADLIPFDSLADLHDLAANLMSHDHGDVELRHPGLDVQRRDVRMAEAAGQRLQDYIAGLCFRIRFLNDFQGLMRSGEFPTFHVSFLSRVIPIYCVLRQRKPVFIRHSFHENNISSPGFNSNAQFAVSDDIQINHSGYETCSGTPIGTAQIKRGRKRTAGFPLR